MQANACCNSTPGRAPPAFLQPLATVLQRCVDLNSAACSQVHGALLPRLDMVMSHWLQCFAACKYLLCVFHDIAC